MSAAFEVADDPAGAQPVVLRLGGLIDRFANASVELAGTRLPAVSATAERAEATSSG